MGRRLLAVAAVSAALAFSSVAQAAEPRAQIKGVSDRTLLQQIQRAVGEEPGTPANRIEARRRARDAAESATALLRTEGYYDYTVSPDIEGEGEHPQPVVTIDPGPRTRFGESAITWMGTAPDATTEEAARKAIALTPGAPARSPDIIGAQGRIVAVLRARGYADAEAAPSPPVVDHADQTMRATFKISAGALVRMDSLRLDTKGRTSLRWIQGLVPWKPGEVYKPDQVAELERRLLETGVYDSVTVALAPAPDAQGLRPVVVSLADRARRTLDFAAGYSTTEGAAFDITYSFFNRLGRGDTLALEARLAQIDSRFGPTLTLPDFWRPGQTLTASTDLFQTVAPAYTETGAEIRGDLTQRYGKTSYFSRGIQIVGSQIDDKELGRIRIGAVRFIGALFLDRTDNTLDPRHGWKLEVRLQPTGIFGGETLGYLKATTQLSGYLPFGLDANTVLAGRVRLGTILGGNIPRVPASDRFFAGGGGSVRGYEYQSVGPSYPDNTPTGGLALFESTLELRHRFAHLFGGNLGGVLFIDTGSVSQEITPQFTHTATGVGFGVRYNLGFAPIRADFAVPVNKLSGAGQAPFQIYISIGQSF